MWKVGADFSPGVSLFLVCLLILNCEVVFAGGNTGGLVAALCVVGAWCLLEERFVPAGILCLAIGLAIKPHSAGLLWLYFLLAGGLLRKRALQTLAVVCVFGLASLLWISRIAPHWMREMSSNIALLSGQGGNNAVGPGSFGMSHADLVIDLQSALSVFWDDPRIYNPVSYLVCGILVLVWAIATLRLRWSPKKGLGWARRHCAFDFARDLPSAARCETAAAYLSCKRHSMGRREMDWKAGAPVEYGGRAVDLGYSAGDPGAIDEKPSIVSNGFLGKDGGRDLCAAGTAGPAGHEHFLSMDLCAARET